MENEFEKLIKESRNYLLSNGYLFRQNKKGMPPRRVIVKVEDQRNILNALHDESGYRGREGIYKKISLQYW